MKAFLSSKFVWSLCIASFVTAPSTATAGFAVGGVMAFAVHVASRNYRAARRKETHHGET